MWFLALWALGLLSGFTHLLITGFGDASNISHILLLHQFVVTFGLVGIIREYCACG